MVEEYIEFAETEVEFEHDGSVRIYDETGGITGLTFGEIEILYRTANRIKNGSKPNK